MNALVSVRNVFHFRHSADDLYRVSGREFRKMIKDSSTRHTVQYGFLDTLTSQESKL